jgi:4-hydroxy-tetrahydrodipicolinate synthase
MAEPLFRGVGVALATLFDDAGEVDAKATAGHAATLVDLGVRAVVVAGSTGEAPTLTAEERIALLTEVRRAVPSGIPVLAGTGAPARREAAALTRSAVDHGAGRPPGALAARQHRPAWLLRGGRRGGRGAAGARHHYPKSSQPGVPVELLPELPIQGTKDSSGDPERLLAELHTFDGWLYVGASSILTMAGALGCTGAILA